MVTIKPFKGVRYAPEKTPDLSVVVSQPHDRIRPELQEKYYNLSPYNIARIIKGKEQPGDGKTNNIYTRARDAYHNWLREGIFIREQVPALYVTQQTFTLPDGRVRTRQGVSVALELTRYDEGIILPHERTLSASMADRLNLLHTTEANFSGIFMLYPGGGINELLRPVLEQKQPFELRELFEHEVLQQFWIVTDPTVLAAVVEEMAAKRNLIIADGHHRYETALSYRDEMRTKYPDALSSAGFNYRLVTLVSMDDPSLVILPTHRLIHSYNRMSGTEVLTRAKEYFEVTPVADQTAMEAALNAAREAAKPCLGFHDGTSAILTLRDPAEMERLLPDRIPEWRMLDVSVVHELFIERVLGIDKEAVRGEKNIEFVRNVQRGYEAVSQGKANFLLAMNPTRIEQVRVCTAAGERMPQKSTDFYPKMISGLVVLPIGVEERL
jgi:uncharacterized protein (DUF1015 family)